MRIAILSCFYPFRGGIAQFNTAMAEELGKENIVKAFNFTRQYPEFLFPGKTQYVTADDEAVPTESTPVLDTANPFSYFHTVKKIKEWKPDVLIISWWMSYFAPSLGFVAGKMNRHCKVISVLHNVIPHEPKFFDKPLTKYFLSKCHGHITLCSEVTKDLIKLIPDAKFTELFHPIYTHFGKKTDRTEATKKLKIDSETKNLLFFGLIRPYKGLDILLQAFELLDDSYRLIIAGEPYGSFAKYRDMINSSKGKSRISLFPFFIKNSDVATYFSAADLTVLPYRNASQSGISAVSWHFEVPLIVTNAGGLKKIIEETGTGLVASEITPESICNEISRYFNNKEIQENCLLNIKTTCKKLSWKVFCKEIISFTNKL